MNLADEVNLLMESLIAAWGILYIECAWGYCVLSDHASHNITAPTLIEALRLAAKEEGIVL